MDNGPKKNVYELLNTRIFPRNMGADSYNITGIASRCDWIVSTDLKNSSAKLYGDLSKQPRTVFLSLRSLFHAIPYFYEQVLPRITNRFVLVSGSSDMTIPNQTDLRWRPFDQREKSIIEQVRTDKRIIHWFAENRDEVRSKMSSLPLGCIPNKNHCSAIQISESVGKLSDKPLKILCAHRHREGDQWRSREKVTRLCEGRFSKGRPGH